MNIDLKKLRFSGKTEQSYYFEYTPISEIDLIPNTKIVLPVRVTGNVSLTGMHSAYVSGEISITVAGECTRCLESTENSYVFEYAEQVEPNNPEGYSVVNDVVDLAKIVDDTVIMNLPVSFLCKEDCKGICLNCGVNLNKEDCKCKK